MTVQYFEKPRFGDVKVRWPNTIGSESNAISILDTIDGWIGQDFKPRDVPSVWVTLAGEDLDYLNIFLKRGFSLHRIKPGNVLVLNRWIREHSFTLPPAPYAYLGLGALCYNDKGQVIAVRENYKTGPGPWKLPGGLYDPRKDKKLSDAAVRECFEETGIEADFECVVCQRFTPVAQMFHKQDVYTICRLRARTTEIKYDPVEIADCKWWDPKELLEVVPSVVRAFMEPAMNNKHGSKEILNAWHGRDAWVYVPEE